MVTPQEQDDTTRSVAILGPGTVISHYEIIRKLGAGGMGEVFLARDTNLDRKVALKFLNPSLASDPVFRERFMREARLAAAFNHPNIITVYEVAECDERVFIALEYIEGSSIRELIDQKKLTLETTLNYMNQICEGLHAAHSSRLIHRDIKPANIIVDTANRVRILDFGLAKAEGDMQLTQAGTALGTVSYMSPEQAQGQESDHRGDIFALGVILYEMLTGCLPFKGDNIPATLYAITHTSPLQLAEFNPSLPANLQSVIEKALAKTLDQRYQSAAALRDDLKGGMSRAEVSSTITGTVEIKPAVKSLAVMYLRNLGSEDDEFLCYGLTEDLIVDLTRIGAIRVAPMRSVMRFKDSDADLPEIAARLNVSMVLDGSIMKSGNVIRISAQLVDIASDENLWAKRWEESFDNLPRVKKDLADGISQALQLGQTVIARAQMDQPVAGDAEAYEFYLKAKFHFSHKKDKTDVDIAMGLYNLALREDPDLLAAEIGIAEIMMYNGDFGDARKELEQALKKARDTDRRADEASILKLLAGLHARQSEWSQAQEFAEKALVIHRHINDMAGEASTLGTLISILQPQAKFDEAIQSFDRVLEISRHLDDREQTAEALKSMGIAYSRKGDYERALDLYNECLDIATREDNLVLQASCTSNIGNVYYFRGEFDQAFGQYSRALTIADRLGDRALVARQNLNMGLIKMQSRDHRAGAQLLRSAAEIFKSLGDRSTYAMALVNESQAQLSMGNVDQAIESATTGYSIGCEINNPLVQSDALVQLGSANFFNRNINKAVECFQEALHIAENSNITRNVAHIHLALVNICFYCKEYEKCRNHATRALSIAREIGDKTALLQSNAGLAAISACEGLFNTGLKQLQDAYSETEHIGNHQMSIHLKALLGEVLRNHGKTPADKEEGMTYLDQALEMARNDNLAPEIKLIEEIIAQA